MSNKEELLKSIRAGLRGSSLIFYWGLAWLSVLITSLLIGVVTGGAGLLGIIVYWGASTFVIIYGTYLLQRGIEGIGRYYSIRALLDGATVQFILWLLMLLLPPIFLIPLGLKMSSISGTLYNLTEIKDFEVARNRWRWTAYLAIILVGGLIALLALYSTRRGFKEMINQMTQQ